MRFVLVLIFLLTAFHWGVSQTQKYLNHYGVLVLEDNGISKNLAARFNAEGNPIFLVHDLQVGITEGDIIRFKDKVVLIDADVWETLKIEGALTQIKKSPLLVIQAKGNSSSWNTRVNKLSNRRSQKAHKLGAEFLKILEEHFGKIPSRRELVLEFKGDDLVLIAPEELLDELPFTRVRKVIKGEGPEIISSAPSRLYLGQEMSWTLWAVDQEQPTKEISYSLTGTLPPGLAWDPEQHTISGTPADSVGTWWVTVFAVNKQDQMDSLEIGLTIVQNKPPGIINRPETLAVPEKPWEFIPDVSDPDHSRDELTLEVVSLPENVLWDSTEQKLSWVPDAQAAGDSMEVTLRVTDPLGASADFKYRVRVQGTNLPPRFLSAMGVWKLIEGDSAIYKPVAVDPEQGGVSLSFQLPRDGSITWEGGKLVLRGLGVGAHTAEILAVDSMGSATRQNIGYVVQPKKKIWTGIYLHTNIVANVQIFDLVWERGPARVGFYTLDIGNLFEDEKFYEKKWPLLFVGASLLGHRQLLRNQYLYLDFGMSLRKATSTITVGGLMVRTEARLKAPGPIPGYVEAEAHAGAQQGIIIANANNTDVDGFIRQADEGLRDLFNDYNTSKNLVAFMRLEGWYPVGYNTWTGPITWRTDNPLFNKHYQRIGWGVRNTFETWWFRGTHSLRVGFGGSSAGFAAHWDAKISFGSWN